MEQFNDGGDQRAAELLKFDYQLLSRLQQDCEYYLGAGQRHAKHLWALNEVEQIQKMKELYAGLPEKPEWLTLADIEKYEVEMVGSVGSALTDGKPAKSPGMGM